MNEHLAPVEDLTQESAKRGKDRKTRRILDGLVALWLITLAALVGVAWNGYFDQKNEALTLAQQIDAACASGDFGPGVNATDQEALCSNAQKVIDNNQQGLQGLTSPRGPQGETGPQGLQGPPGPPGIDGKNGLDGADGNNGPPGADGAAGETGATGANGQDGVNGADGAPGPAGPEGPPGPPGADGKDGADGATGPAGPTGVVAINMVNCDGPVLKGIIGSYDEETKTITITCNPN